MVMKRMARLAVATIVAAPMVLLAGCATQEDLNALRSEVAKSQEMARAAEQRAVEAESAARKSAQEAARAADEAAAAGDKADSIFRESLRK
jgi:thiamine biosynthesis lipoprotein ApbE